MEKNSFEREVLDRLMRLETKIDLQDYKGISEKVDNAETKCLQNERDINEIKDKLKWITRTTAAAIITALVGLVFVFIKIGLGVN